jgi:imidazolonepropionase
VQADLLIHNTAEILTCRGPAPRCGARQAAASPVDRGVVASDRGTIVFVGTEREWRRTGTLAPDAVVVDAAGGAVVPGFVDAHTHVAFAGDRRHELQERLAGASYADIAAGGGGILATVRATRETPEEALLAGTRRRLDEMLRLGTTTCEAKSGYGLSTQSELKILRVLQTLRREHPIDIVPTFMGAHEVPPEYRGRTSDYVDLVTGDMIPAVASAALAEWCDVFCERDVFSTEHARTILTSGRKAGLAPRIHAEELERSGGALVAAEIGARSADHLIFAAPDDAAALAKAGTVATLLPAASLYLKLGRFAPARMLIDHGVAVALATDVNPGGGFSPSMPFVITLACFAMSLTFEEALVGATLNAAYSLDRHAHVGSLEPAKQMDAVVVDGPAMDLIRGGADTIRLIVKKGRIIDPHAHQ